MLEKGRISVGQMALIMFSATTATQTLSLPSLTGPIAGRICGCHRFGDPSQGSSPCF